MYRRSPHIATRLHIFEEFSVNVLIEELIGCMTVVGGFDGHCEMTGAHTQFARRYAKWEFLREYVD